MCQCKGLNMLPVCMLKSWESFGNCVWTIFRVHFTIDWQGESYITHSELGDITLDLPIKLAS